MSRRWDGKREQETGETGTPYKCLNNFWGKLWALIPVFSPCVKYGLKWYININCASDEKYNNCKNMHVQSILE